MINTFKINHGVHFSIAYYASIMLPALIDLLFPCTRAHSIRMRVCCAAANNSVRQKPPMLKMPNKTPGKINSHMVFTYIELIIFWYVCATLHKSFWYKNVVTLPNLLTIIITYSTDSDVATCAYTTWVGGISDLQISNELLFVCLIDWIIHHRDR